MGSSSCELRVVIDKSATGGTFTNFDKIRGKVFLKVISDISLNLIQVKLEGISKTQIEIPKDRTNNRKTKPVFELHRLLYDTSIVFPTRDTRTMSPNAKDFTLLPGNYEYPFEFIIPLKNRCSKLKGISNKVQSFHNSANTGIEIFSQAEKHVEMNLPPSLSGLGDIATIKYFVKATAKRSGFLKSNIRSYEPFIFLPIDSSNMLTFNDRQVFTRNDFVIKNKYPELVAVYEKSTRIPPAPQQQLQEQHSVPIPQARESISQGTSQSPTIRRTSSSSFFKAFFMGVDYNKPNPPSSPTASRRSSTPSNLAIGQQSNYRDSQTSLPTPPSPSLASYSKVKPKDLHVNPINLRLSLEIRFRYPAYVIPTKPPNYKLYLITNMPPSTFQLFNGESSGLGSIYLRYLKVDLISLTKIRASSFGGEDKTKETVYCIKDINYKIDLAECKKSQLRNNRGETLYEVEIPKKMYHKAILPDHIAPSFNTCNINRSYKLIINVGFSESYDSNTVQIIPLETNIEILSGLEPPTQNLEFMEIPRDSSNVDHRYQRERNFSVHQIQTQTHGNQVNSDYGRVDETLPTYDQVIKESNYIRTFEQSDQYYINLED